MNKKGKIAITELERLKMIPSIPWEGKSIRLIRHKDGKVIMRFSYEDDISSDISTIFDIPLDDAILALLRAQIDEILR